jgi:hypothetical protein
MIKIKNETIKIEGVMADLLSEYAVITDTLKKEMVENEKFNKKEAIKILKDSTKIGFLNDEERREKVIEKNKELSLILTAGMLKAAFEMSRKED